ncbi:probable 4-coumarate--CoA ligase 1 isoform X2 [Sitodiplosis mosellana]|nr:probable 4-coumarate--CoA ligase 1 isoform X2 [Sitodiplosis mosellana]XP_055299807.1 probable 4-coumarate--CoA ligase 1 isoform X2 [Sitodiplosis mosellana]XP_055299808.1 probable 4-coumarate--CoA ligase 1 isoform X2 [Sitodiplosis mosellana]
MFQTTFDSKANLWRGFNRPQLYNPNINIAQALLRAMKLHGSKIAQISDDSGVCLTFNEIRMKTIRAAQNLQTRGLKPKQVIGLMVDNVPNLSPIVFAAYSTGCPLNALTTSVEKPDVIRMLGITEPSVMICDIKVYDLIKECLTELKNDATIFTFNGTKDSSIAVEHLFEPTGNEENFVPVEVDGVNDIAAILCSSGTTGPFKGVCLSHAMLLAEITAFDICTSDDVLLSISSLQWISGHNTLLLGTLSGATRIITTESFSPSFLLRLINDYKVTVIISVANHMVALLKSGLLPNANMSSVKCFLIRGQRAPYAMINEFNTFLPNGKLYPALGLTEMCGVVTINANGSDSAGQIISGYTFKIVDEAGNRCGVDTNGEICIKVPYKFLGYYKQKDLSASAMDNEGFFLTGDIGFFDKDGNVHIIDRKKDLIVTDFLKISPFEIEEFLIKSPDIKCVCVVGVLSDMNNELPAAVVIREKGSFISEAEICKLVEDNMTDYCKLRGGVYFVDSIPTTPSGKLLRRWCKETATRVYNSKA